MWMVMVQMVPNMMSYRKVKVKDIKGMANKIPIYFLIKEVKMFTKVLECTNPIIFGIWDGIIPS